MDARAHAARLRGLVITWGADRTSWGRTATLSVLGIVSFVLLIGWDGLAPLFTVPVIIGIALGLSSKTRLEATVSALASSLVGGLAATGVYGEAFQMSAFNSMPSWANRDVAHGIYVDVVIPLLTDSPFTAAGIAGKSPLPLLGMAVLCMTATALLAIELHRATVPKIARMAAAWAVIVILAVSLVVGIGGRHAATIASMSDVARPGTAFGSDQELNVKTYYLMSEGQGFYPSYVRAHELDTRQLYKVENGKFATGSAALMRQPAMFYLWQAVAPGGRGRADPLGRLRRRGTGARRAVLESLGRARV